MCTCTLDWNDGCPAPTYPTYYGDVLLFPGAFMGAGSGPYDSYYSAMPTDPKYLMLSACFDAAAGCDIKTKSVLYLYSHFEAQVPGRVWWNNGVESGMDRRPAGKGCGWYGTTGVYLSKDNGVTWTDALTFVRNEITEVTEGKCLKDLGAMCTSQYGKDIDLPSLKAYSNDNNDDPIQGNLFPQRGSWAPLDNCDLFEAKSAGSPSGSLVTKYAMKHTETDLTRSDARNTQG